MQLQFESVYFEFLPHFAFTSPHDKTRKKYKTQCRIENPKQRKQQKTATSQGVCPGCIYDF